MALNILLPLGGLKMKDNNIELISKKQLLELTKISYGQLYRWKRKKLIPEEWFIKKSSFTGQETFFPKDKILDRIDKIVNMKDDLSLTEIANMFSPNVTEISIKKDEFKNRNIVDDMTINIYNNMFPTEDIFYFQDILLMYVLEQFIKSGDASIEEGKNILDTVKNHFKTVKDKNFEVILLRKFGASICIIHSVPSEFFIEQSAKLVKKINLAKCVEEIKLKVSNHKT